MPIYVSSENPDYYWCDIDNIEKSNNPINNEDNMIQTIIYNTSHRVVS